MEKKQIEIDKSFQKSISYSQYSLYNQCQYQWYLSYALNNKIFNPNIFLIYGTSLHEVIQSYLQKMYSESGAAADRLDLNTLFEDRMIENYKSNLKDNNNIHFSTKEDIKEFIEDGKKSLEWFKKNRNKFFSRKTSSLVGIEIPILIPVSDYSPNVFMKGFIDLVIHNTNTDTYTIFDIKTSTRGWTDKEKKDQTKINQVLLYKRFYSKILNIPEERIDVQFFIIKRKIYEDSEFPIPRVQEFIPANGKKKVQEAFNSLESFIKECFTPDAKYNLDRQYLKNTNSCKYCPYSKRPDLCNKKN